MKGKTMRKTSSNGSRLATLACAAGLLAAAPAAQLELAWTLKDAMPIAYELAPMDGARSEVLTESVTFAIHGVDREASTLSLLWQAMEG